MRPERRGGVAGKLMATGGGGGRPAPPSLWKTPTPYLFLCLAAILALIVVALLVLLCTRRKPAPPPSSSQQLQTEVHGEKVGTLVPLDREEPRVVVVVMAGERDPSFLATAMPLAFASDIAAAAVEPVEAHGSATV